MTGSNAYNEFDTTSIISKDTVSIGKFTMRKREAVYGGIAILALIVVIILAIVLAVEVGNCQSASHARIAPQTGNVSTNSGTSQTSNVSTNSGTSQTGNVPTTSSTPQPGNVPTNSSTPQPGNVPTNSSACQPGNVPANSSTAQTDYCSTAPCLKTAYYEKSIMNESVNPCINFYQFACGGYADVYKPSPLIPNQTPYDQILNDNVQKLIYLIQYEPERNEENSYERKLRHFVKSCANHFDKMELKGKPLIEKVLNQFEGVYLLGKWNASSFNLQSQLKKVHADFWTSAFFNIGVSTDIYDWNKKVLEIYFGGLGMDYSYYNYSEFKAVYKDYMTTVSGYIARDAGLNDTTVLLSQFVDDALEVETELASAIAMTPVQYDPHAAENRMTLGALNQLTNNTLNLVEYFTYTFPDLPGGFIESSTVAVLGERFFNNLGPMLVNYSSTDDGKRKLHNYLVWQLIDTYLPYLSWDYVHARRQLYFNLYGIKDFSSGFSDCFKQAQRSMKEAMGALFVKDYINQKDKQEASDILTMIKEEMLQQIKSLNWMSIENRNDAVKKITESIYKIGYPDYMVDEAYMDSLYSHVAIDDNDYFGNVLSLNIAHKKHFRDVLAMPDSKTMWAYHILYPIAEYYNPWHELIVTAAVFQNPLFAHNGPGYYNYGGIGTILASTLIHAIDEYGSHYKLDKSNLGNWWTTVTQEHYRTIRECAINAQKGAQLGPYKTSIFTEYSPNMTVLARMYAPELLAEASGLRLSLKAYKTKMAIAGTEKLPPGFTKYSLEKMFFVAYAQFAKDNVDRNNPHTIKKFKNATTPHVENISEEKLSHKKQLYSFFFKQMAHCQNTPDRRTAMNIMIYNRVPSEYNVNHAVSQVPEFREAFDCMKGDPMAAQTTCTLF